MSLNVPIKNIMTSRPITVFTDTPFAEIKNIFEQNSFNHIPVINKDETLAGIISKIDWLKRLKYIIRETSGKTWTDKYFETLTAGMLMTPNPVTLGPDDPIELVADLIIENKYHALPIVDDDRLIGIITSHDLITFAFYKNPVGEN